MNMMDSTVFFDAIEPQSIHALKGAGDDPFLDDDEELADNESDKPSASESKSSSSRRGQASCNGMPARPRIKIASSPLVHTTRARSESPPTSPDRLARVDTAGSARRPSEYEAKDGYTDERARDVIIGRLVHGHIVDDDHPSPALSAMSASMSGFPGERSIHDVMDNPAYDPMMSSFISTTSSLEPSHALGGTFDAAATSDEEEEGIKNPEVEHTVTLVGNVKDRTAILMDDMLDKSGSWVAAAETCVKRGSAKKVYCVAIHALFSQDSLEELEDCDCIDYIVVTNTFPIPPQRLRQSKKLIVIDLSNLLSEAIRRNHHGG